jgi:hypothetical protein
MLVGVRQIPSTVGGDLPLYRVEISQGPGQRPTCPPLLRGIEGLRYFLCSKLGQPKVIAERVVAELSSNPYSLSALEDVRINQQALDTIIRECDAAEKVRLDALMTE